MASQACLQHFPVPHESSYCSSYLQRTTQSFCRGVICKGHTRGIPISLRNIFHAPRAVSKNQNQPAFENGMPSDMNELLSFDGSQLSRETNTATAQNKYPSIGNEGEDPYRILESGRKVYLDELDVLTLLDPPTYLKPIDAEIYDQPAYLWKKIADIPEERRNRLLDLLTPKHIESMWNIAGQNFRDLKSSQIDAANFLLGSDSEVFLKPVTWSGRLYKGIWPASLFSRFQKSFFLSTDGSVYGRVIVVGDILRWIYPTYLEVREVRKVVFTEEPCNTSLDYGDGQLHLSELPKDFPKPGKHMWPLSDASVDYIRPVGPGVLVGQWWVEGIDLDQVPRKCGDFVLIKNYEIK